MVRRWTGGSSSEPACGRRRGDGRCGGRGSQARRDCGVPRPLGRQRHLVEPVQDGGVAVPADPGDRRRPQVQPPVEVGRPERPGHRGLDRGHVAHDDDVAVAAAGAAPVGRRTAPRRRRRSARPPRPATRRPPDRSHGRAAISARRRRGCRPAAGTRTRRSRPRSSARRRRPGGRARGASAVSTARQSGLERSSTTGRSSSVGTAAAWARPVSVSSASVRPSNKPWALATDSPWRTRISTGCGRPLSWGQDAPALLARRDLSWRQCTNALDLDGGKLEVAPVAVAPDQPRRAGALQAGCAGSRTGRQRGRQLGSLGGTRPGGRGDGGIDLEAFLLDLFPQFLRLHFERSHPLTQRGKLGVDRIQLRASMTSSCSSSWARRSVRCLTSSFIACRSRADELVAA